MNLRFPEQIRNFFIVTHNPDDIFIFKNQVGIGVEDPQTCPFNTYNESLRFFPDSGIPDTLMIYGRTAVDYDLLGSCLS